MNLKLTWTVTLGIQTHRRNIVFIISKVAVHQFKKLQSVNMYITVYKSLV